jgi:AP-2 complex subunit alpha
MSSSSTVDTAKDQQSLATSSPTVTGGAPRLTVAPGLNKLYEELLWKSDGKLYEDVQIQVGIQSKYQAHFGHVAIYIGNKITAPLTSFTSTVHVSDSEALVASFAKMPPSMIASRAQTQQLLQVECKKAFSTPPILSVSFLAGSHQTIAIRLPIVISKFFSPVKLGQTDFFERWKLIGGPPRESQQVFPIVLTPAGTLDTAKHKQIVTGHHLEILPDVDPNPSNIVAAGVLHMSVEGKVGCLIRMEPNREAKVCFWCSQQRHRLNPSISSVGLQCEAHQKM